MGSNELSISSFDAKGAEEFIPTGIAELDEIIGGGFARGRITELWGKEGVGKTYIATKMIANLSSKQKVLFIDAEFSLNKQRVIELGADPKNIKYVANASLEKVCELILKEVGKYDVIILDSLAVLTPETVANAEIGERSIGLFSLLIKHWILKLRPVLAESKTALIVLNQFRPAIGLYVSEEPPGGKAYHHACDVRIKLTANSSSDLFEGGKWVHAEVKKSKVSKPNVKTKFKLLF